MATLDFPTSPAIGALYPASPAVGQQKYKWDGEKWVAQDQGVIATGTVMLFWQAAAPLGWTKLVTQNDKMLRVVSGSGGASGGTNAFSTVMAQTASGNSSLVAASVGVHDHSPEPYLLGHGTGIYWSSFKETGGWLFHYSTPGDGAGGSDAHAHSVQMNMQYIDLIAASKD